MKFSPFVPLFPPRIGTGRLLNTNVRIQHFRFYLLKNRYNYTTYFEEKYIVFVIDGIKELMRIFLNFSLN